MTTLEAYFIYLFGLTLTKKGLVDDCVGDMRVAKTQGLNLDPMGC